MPIPSNDTIKTIVKSNLNAGGFNLVDAPLTELFVDALIDGIVDSIKLATVNTTVTGTSPSGPVTGTGVGGLT